MLLRYKDTIINLDSVVGIKRSILKKNITLIVTENETIEIDYEFESLLNRFFQLGVKIDNLEMI